MCHHYESTARWDEYERARDEGDEDEADPADDHWTPDSFEEDRDTDVEVLTDGGDEA